MGCPVRGKKVYIKFAVIAAFAGLRLLQGEYGMKMQKLFFAAAAALLVLLASCASTGGSTMPADATIDERFASGVPANIYKTYGSGDTASNWGLDGDKVSFSFSRGGKVEFYNSTVSDGTVEVNLTLDQGTGRGNSGFLVRSSGYNNGVDGVNAYFVGIGRNNNNSVETIDGVDIGPGQTFLQVGLMQNNWKQLYNVPLSSGAAEYPINHRLAVSMSGPDFVVSVDGNELISFSDSTYASGSVGFRTFEAEGSINGLVVTQAE